MMLSWIFTAFMHWACGPDAIHYQTHVEPGLYAPEFHGEVFRILNAPGGWTEAGHGNFCPGGNPNFVVVLATPATTDELCAPIKTMGRVSCARSHERAVINLDRWRNGAPYWALQEYREYLINHEVGHVLGMGHRYCPTPEDGGKPLPTPVMKQQSSNRINCPRNGTPTPTEIYSMSRLKWRSHNLKKKVVSFSW